jgi:tetratricopeptide (TPR) repeat protein
VKNLNIISKVLNFSAERYLKTAGDLFVYQGDYESALRMVEKTLEIQPNDIRALVLRGDILYCLNRDLESLQTLSYVLTLAPDCIEAHVSRAGVLDVLGRYKEALQSCERAAELMQPRYLYLLPGLYDQKIQLLLRLKRYRQAKRLLAQAAKDLPPDEFEFLQSSYRTCIENGCRERTLKRQQANQLSLKVIG